jgi:hypothetical protein
MSSIGRGRIASGLETRRNKRAGTPPGFIFEGPASSQSKVRQNDKLVVWHRSGQYIVLLGSIIAKCAPLAAQ